jgi:CheY-like chemotaxis protein
VTETLLLVEDDPNDQLLMLRSLRRLNVPITLRSVENGEEAMSYLAGTGIFADRERFPLPKLTLLDVKMPGRSGFEVLKWIRAQPDIGELVIVMLTSSKEPEDVERAYRLKANSYLVKPGDAHELQSLNELIVNYWVAKNVAPPRMPT